MAYSRPTLVQGTTSSAIGTGNATLTDVTGKQSFSTVADGATLHYVIQDNPADAVREWGLGTKTTSGGKPVLQRTAANVLGPTAGVLSNFTASKQTIYAGPIGDVDVHPNVTADPSVSSPGQMIYRTDTNDLRVYAGSTPAWVSVLRSDTIGSFAVSSFNTRQGAVTLTNGDVDTAAPNLAYQNIANTFTVGPQTFKPTDSGTNNVANAITLYHHTTASLSSVAAGFGVSHIIQLDSTTQARNAAEWDTTWVVATDGSRKARIQGFVYDSTQAREWIRAESDGTLPIVGICGAAQTQTMLTVYPASDTYKGLAVRANSASQSANLFELQDSTGVAQISGTAAGVMSFGNPSGGNLANCGFNIYGNNGAIALSIHNDGNAGSNFAMLTSNQAIEFNCPGFSFKTPQTWDVYGAASPLIFRGYSPFGTDNAGGGGGLILKDAQTGVLVFDFDIGLGQARWAPLATGTVLFIMKGIASQTADFLQIKNSSNTILDNFGSDGRFYNYAPSAAPTDGNLQNSQITAWLDEAGNNLKFRVKYSNGTLKTATIALT